MVFDSLASPERQGGRVAPYCIAQVQHLMRQPAVVGSCIYHSCAPVGFQQAGCFCTTRVVLHRERLPGLPFPAGLPTIPIHACMHFALPCCCCAQNDHSRFAASFKKQFASQEVESLRQRTTPTTSAQRPQLCDCLVSPPSPSVARQTPLTSHQHQQRASEAGDNRTAALLRR